MREDQSRNAASHLLDATAQRDGSRVAVIAGSAPHTYGEISAMANRIGNALRHRGCAPGDRVLVALPDAGAFAASFFGALKIGAIAVPLSGDGALADLEHYLSDAEPRFGLVGSASAAGLRAARECIEVLDSSSAAFLSQFPDSLDGFEGPEDHPALLLYTSGTTARQKGVLHSHRSLIAASRNVGAAVFGYRPSDRVLSMARTSFAFGLGFGLCFPFSAGATVIQRPPTQSLEEISQWIAAHRPTILVAVPTFLASLLKAAQTWLKIDLSSVRFVAAAGEPLRSQVYEGYRNVFGVEVVDGIGSTELLTHFISHRPGHSRPGSCGTVVPGCEVQLLGENGEQVTGEDIGALRVRSESAFLGYWNQPERTAQVRRSEWVITGDRLRIESPGHYVYWGRDDDMTKIGGMWISPGDVETALCEHPAVERALVTTRDDRHGTRRLVAYVESPDRQSTPQELLRHLADRVPEHMLPSSIVVVAQFPLTSTGKLDKRSLPAPSWS